MHISQNVEINVEKILDMLAKIHMNLECFNI